MVQWLWAESLILTPPQRHPCASRAGVDGASFPLGFAFQMRFLLEGFAGDLSVDALPPHIPIYLFTTVPCAFPKPSLGQAWKEVGGPLGTSPGGLSDYRGSQSPQKFRGCPGMTPRQGMGGGSRGTDCAQVHRPKAVAGLRSETVLVCLELGVQVRMWQEMGLEG